MNQKFISVCQLEKGLINSLPPSIESPNATIFYVLDDCFFQSFRASSDIVTFRSLKNCSVHSHRNTFLFWPHLQHVEVPRLGTEPVPQQ